MAQIAGLNLSYDVVQCPRCAAAYADALAAPADYAAYYENCSKYDRIGGLEDISAIDRCRARFAGQFVAENVTACDRVLDLGCGSGVLLAQLRGVGARRLNGIDPAPHAQESAQRLFGLDGVRQGTIVEANRHFELDRFDLLCMTAVLEHLANPLEILRSVASQMAAQATLLIEVPALEGFSRPPLEPYGELSLEHINFFSAGSLIEMAARAGLHPLATAILSLWPLGADSLFVLLRKDAPSSAGTRANDWPLGGSRAVAHAGANGSAELGAAGAERRFMGEYLAESARATVPVLARASSALRGGDALLWGAGSHSARLLPMLERLGLEGNIRSIVDANPNLHGRTFGRHEVESIEALANRPEATVIISSFRSSAAIAARLRSGFPNPVCELYDALPAPERQSPA